MKWLLLIGIVLMIVAVVLLVTGLTGPAVGVGLLGIVAVLAAVIRRFGRPGDFSRSGWTGQ